MNFAPPWFNLFFFFIFGFIRSPWNFSLFLETPCCGRIWFWLMPKPIWRVGAPWSGIWTELLSWPSGKFRLAVGFSKWGCLLRVCCCEAWRLSPWILGTANWPVSKPLPVLFETTRKSICCMSCCRLSPLISSWSLDKVLPLNSICPEILAPAISG